MSENYDGIEFKEVDRKKKVRKKKNYLLRFLVFVGILAAVTLFLSSGFFVIEKIEVQGNVYYNDEEVINISGSFGEPALLRSGTDWGKILISQRLGLNADCRIRWS